MLKKYTIVSAVVLLSMMAVLTLVGMATAPELAAGEPAYSLASYIWSGSNYLWSGSNYLWSGGSYFWTGGYLWAG